MNTAFLMAQYDGAAVIPIEKVARDYFPHLTPEKLVRKISAGEIALPMGRIEASQGSAKGVHLQDLARWVDERAAARRECAQLCGRSRGDEPSASPPAHGGPRRPGSMRLSLWPVIFA